MKTENEKNVFLFKIFNLTKDMMELLEDMSDKFDEKELNIQKEKLKTCRKNFNEIGIKNLKEQK